jgi:beta-phosphoglucomutase-like phosphatase (HAD superfamily)
VKVDDTTSGIEAGIHAGCWTVGIAKTVSTFNNHKIGFDLFIS